VLNVLSFTGGDAVEYSVVRNLKMESVGRKMKSEIAITVDDPSTGQYTIMRIRGTLVLD
jgi:hypothetical protein